MHYFRNNINILTKHQRESKSFRLLSKTKQAEGPHFWSLRGSVAWTALQNTNSMLLCSSNFRTNHNISPLTGQILSGSNAKLEDRFDSPANYALTLAYQSEAGFSRNRTDSRGVFCCAEGTNLRKRRLCDARILGRLRMQNANTSSKKRLNGFKKVKKETQMPIQSSESLAFPWQFTKKSNYFPNCQSDLVQRPKKYSACKHLEKNADQKFSQTEIHKKQQPKLPKDNQIADLSKVPKSNESLGVSDSRHCPTEKSDALHTENNLPRSAFSNKILYNLYKLDQSGLSDAELRIKIRALYMDDLKNQQ